VLSIDDSCKLAPDHTARAVLAAVDAAASHSKELPPRHSKLPHRTPYVHTWGKKLHHATFVGRSVMTSTQAHPGVAIKIFYFSLAATVFVFVSMLLMTGLHP
jgi:hypothetical protein